MAIASPPSATPAEIFHRVDISELKANNDPRVTLAGIHNTIVAAIAIEFGGEGVKMSEEARRTIARCISGYWTASKRDVKEAEAMALKVLETFERS